MISGSLDASVIPALATDALAHLPKGRQVKIRYYGHQIDDACVWRMLSDFIDTGAADKVDTACTENIRRPAFPKELRVQF
jgi:hypothetical protein